MPAAETLTISDKMMICHNSVVANASQIVAVLANLSLQRHI